MISVNSSIFSLSLEEDEKKSFFFFAKERLLFCRETSSAKSLNSIKVFGVAARVSRSDGSPSPTDDDDGRERERERWMLGLSFH